MSLLHLSLLHLSLLHLTLLHLSLLHLSLLVPTVALLAKMQRRGSMPDAVRGVEP